MIARFFRAAALLVMGVCLTAASEPVTATPITDGLELWLDATDAATFTFDSGTLVSQWQDKSGQDNHAATGSNFPLRQEGVIGGLPAVTFDRQPLTIGGGINVAGAQSRTAFVVMDYSVQTNNNEILGTSTGNMMDVGSWNRPWRLRLRQGDNAFSAANALPAGSHVIAVQADSSGTRAWSDGKRIIATADERFHWGMDSNLGIGGANYAGREYIGNLGEVLVYNRSLTPLEANEVGYYLQGKFNLTGSYVDPAILSASPLPVSDGLQLWLDATDAATFTFDSGTLVSQWLDKSGHNNHAATGSNFPSRQENVINGLAAVRFQSTQGGAPAGTPLDIPSGLDIAADQDRTVLLVFNYEQFLVNNEIFGPNGGQIVDVGTWTPSGNQQGRLRFRNDGTNVFSPAGTVPLGANLLAIQADGSGVRAWRNGAQIMDDPTNAFNWDMNAAMQVGGANFDTRTFHGDLAEMIVFDRALSEQELQDVGLHLQQKYSLFGIYDAPVAEGLKLWLDASDPRTLVLDPANQVSGWLDRSGNGHDASPISAAPTWTADGVNGRPAIDFDRGVRMPMSIAGDMGIADAQERTVFVVFDYDGLFNNNEILGTSTGRMIDVGTWTPSGQQDERLRLRYDSVNEFSDEGDLPLGPHVLVVQARSDGTLAWADGEELINTSELAAHWPIGSNLKIGGTNYGGTDTREFDGRIAEILFYDRALSADEIGQVGAYLEQKYFGPEAVIPEPSSLFLFSLGALALVALARRHKQ